MHTHPVPRDMVLLRGGVYQDRPDWVDDLRGKYSKSYDSLQREEILPPDPRMEFEGNHFSAVVVLRRNGDVIFQFFPRGNLWPKDLEGGRNLLATVIEGHFGSTDQFSADFVKELRSWAVKAEGLRGLASYTEEYHLEGFLNLLDLTISELAEA